MHWIFTFVFLGNRRIKVVSQIQIFSVIFGTTGQVSETLTTAAPSGPRTRTQYRLSQSGCLFGFVMPLGNFIYLDDKAQTAAGFVGVTPHEPGLERHST